MSRASAWAAAPVARELAVAFTPQRGLLMVERSGDLYLELRHEGLAVIGASLSPTTAMDIAHWILDTFGEDTR